MLLHFTVKAVDYITKTTVNDTAERRYSLKISDSTLGDTWVDLTRRAHRVLSSRTIYYVVEPSDTLGNELTESRRFSCSSQSQGC